MRPLWPLSIGFGVALAIAPISAASPRTIFKLSSTLRPCGRPIRARWRCVVAPLRFVTTAPSSSWPMRYRGPAAFPSGARRAIKDLAATDLLSLRLQMTKLLCTGTGPRDAYRGASGLWATRRAHDASPRDYAAIAEITIGDGYAL